jgi:hypothetical protein
MEPSEEKSCAKCGSKIICETADIEQCQCASVPLSKGTQLFLSKTYFGCLCKECLAKINKEVEDAQLSKFPTQKKMMIEELHYYKEGSNWVFTEFYHLLRGFCCRSGCRHCVYGYKTHYGIKKH